MTTPTSRAAYKVQYDILDRALDSRTGIRIEARSEGEANQLRVRLHSARSLDRELNRESRDPTDPSYGVSDYDNLIVRIRADKGKWWVYIERAAVPGVIEEIGDAGSHSHRPNEAPRDVPLHNLRREVQPKPPAMDNAQVPTFKPWPIRGL